MNNLQQILASKRVLRQKLAGRPLAEKLRLLDDLRECALTLRRSGPRRFTTKAPSRVGRDAPQICRRRKREAARQGGERA